MSQICPPSVSAITASYSQVKSEKSVRAEGLMRHSNIPGVYSCWNVEATWIFCRSEHFKHVVSRFW